MDQKDKERIEEINKLGQNVQVYLKQIEEIKNHNNNTNNNLEKNYNSNSCITKFYNYTSSTKRQFQNFKRSYCNRI